MSYRAFQLSLVTNLDISQMLAQTPYEPIARVYMSLGRYQEFIDQELQQLPKLLTESKPDNLSKAILSRRIQQMLIIRLLTSEQPQIGGSWFENLQTKLQQTH